MKTCPTPQQPSAGKLGPCLFDGAAASPRPPSVWLIPLCLLVPLLLMLGGCSRDDTARSPVTTLEVWAHTGQESERNTLQQQAAMFNATHHDLQIRLTLIPEGSYNAQVQAAAVAGELPDLLEFDGPFLYAYVWQGRLRPLDDLLADQLRDDLLPSIIEQGQYQERLWSLGTFDSGLGLYADRSKLAAAGIRIPNLERPWSRDEFNDILERLARDDPDAPSAADPGVAAAHTHDVARRLGPSVVDRAALAVAADAAGLPDDQRHQAAEHDAEDGRAAESLVHRARSLPTSSSSSASRAPRAASRRSATSRSAR